MLYVITYCIIIVLCVKISYAPNPLAPAEIFIGAWASPIKAPHGERAPSPHNEKRRVAKKPPHCEKGPP